MDDAGNPYQSPQADLRHEPPAEARREWRFAGFWIRLAARLVDDAVFIPVIILAMVAVKIHSGLLLVLVCIPALFYKPLMESRYGATLGKMACRLEVVDRRGQRLSLGAAYVRSLPVVAAHFVPLVYRLLVLANFQPATVGRSPLGWPRLLLDVYLLIDLIDCLCVAFNDRKRAIHDMMAGSFCVYASPGIKRVKAMMESMNRP